MKEQNNGDLSPVQSDPYECRARAFAALGKRQAAIEDLKQSGRLTLERLKRVNLQEIKSEPSSFFFYTARATAWLYNRNFQEAAKDADQAISLLPDDGAYRLRALTHLAQGDNKGAIANYTQIINCCPRNGEAMFAPAYFLRAIAWSTMNEQSHALEDLGKVRHLLSDQEVKELQQETNFESLFLDEKALAVYNQSLASIEHHRPQRQSTQPQENAWFEPKNCPSPCIY